MLEKLVRSMRSVVGGILSLVFKAVFGFVSAKALRGNGTTLRPVPFAVEFEMAILKDEPVGHNHYKSSLSQNLESSEIPKKG
jgi:hypothetical protein